METKSPKEHIVEAEMLSLMEEIVSRHTEGDDLPLRLTEALLNSPELKAMQDYANNVSIVRLGLNDHGPVHMKIVCVNALKMLLILNRNGVKTSLEKEKIGTFADSVSAVLLSSVLHDSGMTIGRKDHELYSGIVSYSFIDSLLKQFMTREKDTMRRTMIRSLAMEGILGHMGTRLVHSIEAGIVLIADGCDMTKGRARITLEIPSKPTEGDIHKYSANSIQKVIISQGKHAPIRIDVLMKSEVGLFQVEAVLIPKIQSSPAKHLVELYAVVEGQDEKRYI
ncbi:MAG: hypothetical protein K6G73_09780 [Marinilabiliaceae bacterium]|nr:hypothetical protein [Marinilabiliaceae bacterium]